MQADGCLRSTGKLQTRCVRRWMIMWMSSASYTKYAAVRILTVSERRRSRWQRI